MNPYVLGIDGGGSKTLAAIMDRSGRVLGTGRAGPSNVDDLDVLTVMNNIAGAIVAARQQAGLEAQPFAACFLGLAGVTAEADRALVRHLAAELHLAPPDAVGVDHDARAALAGGLSGRPGLVVIVGTGSVCFGQNAAGETWRSGGWGQLVGDEGGGFWLVREALIAAVRAQDGRGEPTRLLPELLTSLDVQEPDDLLRRLYQQGLTRTELASRAPLVLAVAQGGDAVAMALIERAAAELSQCAVAVAQRLNLTDQPTELTLTGGLISAGEVMAKPLRLALDRALPNAVLVSPALPPVLGACLLALRLVGIASAPELLRQVAHAVPAD